MVNVSTQEGCSWTAVLITTTTTTILPAPTSTTTTNNDTEWIIITSGSSGIGNGKVSYEVAANTGTTARTGTMTIAGKTFTVTQAGTAE